MNLFINPFTAPFDRRGVSKQCKWVPVYDLLYRRITQKYRQLRWCHLNRSQNQIQNFQQKSSFSSFSSSSSPKASAHSRNCFSNASSNAFGSRSKTFLKCVPTALDGCMGDSWNADAVKFLSPFSSSKGGSSFFDDSNDDDDVAAAFINLPGCLLTCRRI